MGGNTLDDERGIGVLVQASFVMEAAIRIGIRRKAEVLPNWIANSHHAVIAGRSNVQLVNDYSSGGLR